MQTVRVQKDFAAPPERLFAYLSDNDNLGVLFRPARVEHIDDGESARNGVGAVVAAQLRRSIASGLRRVESAFPHA